MALQTKINGSLVPGIVGEFSDGSPKTARAYLCYGTATEKPTFGRLFSFVEKSGVGTSDTATCATMGIPSGAKQMGILVNPKEHYIVGFNTGRTLADNGISGTIATQGHIYVMVESVVTAGDPVGVAAGTGKLGKYVSGGTLTEVKGAQWLRTVSANLVADFAEYDSTSTAGYAVGAKAKVTTSGVATYYVCKTAIASGTAAGDFDATKWTDVSDTVVSEALAEVAIDNPGLEG